MYCSQLNRLAWALTICEKPVGTGNPMTHADHAAVESLFSPSPYIEPFKVSTASYWKSRRRATLRQPITASDEFRTARNFSAFRSSGNYVINRLSSFFPPTGVYITRPTAGPPWRIQLQNAPRITAHVSKWMA